MSFWGRDLIDSALDDQTRKAVEEQRRWIVTDPSNPRPYYQLALLYRMQGRPDEALGLLLEAVRLDPAFADAHTALAQIYVVRNDPESALRHAREASAQGQPEALEMLRRHGLAEPAP
jgi:cytochrome c-type biogenesis protein CcmH/NrfG